MKSKIIGLIAIYEIIGGIVGLFLIIVDGKFSSIGIFLFILALYLFSLRGGFLLWKKRESGLITSLIVQICQIPCINTVPCIYIGSMGLQVLVGMEYVENIYKLVIYHRWFPYFQISFGNIANVIFIGINITPIIIISQIIRIQKVKRKNELEAENVNSDILEVAMDK